jgi:hypothetical protein
LRSGYRLRCEFQHFLVELGAERDLASTFRALGFRVDTDEDIRREGP